MAGQAHPPTSPPRRPTRTPGRPRIHYPPRTSSGPASKRRKYVPGGPGGGGRWIDTDALETPSTTRGIASSHSSRRGIAQHGGAVDGDEDRAAAAAAAAAAEEDADGTGDFEPDGSASPKTVRRGPASSARPRREGDRPVGRPRRRSVAPTRPRYSSAAAAAAAATQASDGYKPREERGWEEFHPDLNIEAALLLFSADEVDGRTQTAPSASLIKQAMTNGGGLGEAQSEVPTAPVVPLVTPKRKPGRPPRKPESMLAGLGSPPAPRIMPLPTHNPKEKLNLPKPSYRLIDTFAPFEQDRAVQVNYVDKAMANVGYQEGDRFEMPQSSLIRHVEGPYDDDTESGLRLESDERVENPPAVVGSVEYDMDEQDDRWLEAHNAHRKQEQVDPIKPAMFEITMTQIEREYHALEKRIPKPNPRHPQTHRPRSSSAAAVNGEPNGTGDEPDSKCAICDDGDCENANAIIFCDGCDLAVHQECYGVPFIPEGQWFCRKCKEIGRGTPTCIFCPNIDGAFKQTNTLRWSHLLCAIWIPEVTIANTTFMEPIQDVDKVPRSRWGLNCYICNQKMGACIQCSNKVCYQAFHVTCARRARLFLKMKSPHAAGIDSTALKAFCDRHVPTDWRRDHDVDNAIVEAKRYYLHTMRNRRWADSQSAALAMAPLLPARSSDAAEEPAQADDTTNAGAQKRKRSQPQKTGWRLPSGAPVVPSVVFNTVEASLARFALRRRKEFLIEACKYWTLKREARKGAALLKRLQLQLESFSAMEITRRNFAAMGAAGRPRLLRRIDFAELLGKDMDRLQGLVKSVREREELKLVDAEILKDVLDTVYFPIAPLLWPILQRAQKLDEKSGMFKAGLDTLESKLSERYYTSVSAFSADITAIFSPVLARLDGVQAAEAEIRDVADIHEQLNGVPAGTAQHLALTQEQKELKKLAKRIVKAVKEPLAAALQKEAELKGVPFEKGMSEWDAFDARLENGQPKQQSAAHSDESGGKLGSISARGGASPNPRDQLTDTLNDVDMDDADAEEETGAAPKRLKRSSTEPALVLDDIARAPQLHDNTKTHAQPLSPPISTSSIVHTVEAITQAPNNSSAAANANDPWARGGVPWYLSAFDISGTTVHEERWTGLDTIRAMSEALSEMDEETLQDVLEQSNYAVEEEKKPTIEPAAVARRRSLRGSVAAAQLAAEEKEEEEAEEEDEEESEEQKLAREKREKANAKRRATRRRQRW